MVPLGVQSEAIPHLVVIALHGTFSVGGEKQNILKSMSRDEIVLIIKFLTTIYYHTMHNSNQSKRNNMILKTLTQT